MGGLGRWLSLLPSWVQTAWWGLVREPVSRDLRRVVQAVVLGDRGVLLTVRSDLRGWELPGGRVEPGESEEQAIAREVREETGYEVAVERLTGEYHRSGFLPHVARVYRCRVVGGAAQPSDETPLVRWWDPDALPTTLFPWYEQPLRDALAPADPAPVRHERQGAAAIWAGMRIDLRMRASGDRAV